MAGWPLPLALSASLWILLAMCCFDAGASGDGTFFSVSHAHSTGSYGLRSSTDIDETAVAVDHLQGPWSFRMVVPWLRIKGNGGITMGAAGPVQAADMAAIRAEAASGSTGQAHGHGDGMAGGHRPSRTAETGLGDVALKAGYSFNISGTQGMPDEVVLEPALLLKLPTADDDRGLGTGGTDLSVQVDGSRKGGGFDTFLTAGFTVTGDPGGNSYNDQLYASMGADIGLSSAFRLGAVLDLRQKATTSAANVAELAVIAAWTPTADWKVSVSVATGLSDAAPDWTVGLKITMGR